MFSSANILPIADVVHRVVFLLFLLCFWPVVHLFLFRLKCSAILYCSVPKQINIISRASQSAVQFPGNYAVVLMSFFTYQKFLPNLVNSSWLW